jgi:hypothetical protein
MVTGVAEGIIYPCKVETRLFKAGEWEGGVSQLPSHNNYRRVGQSHEMQAVCTNAVNRGDNNLNYPRLKTSEWERSLTRGRRGDREVG